MPAAFLGIDTETTGLSALRNQVIEIYLQLMDENLDVLDTLHVYAYPDDTSIIDTKAIEINGYTPQKWADHNAVSQGKMSQLVYEFISRYKRLKCIAHNTAFDTAFLRQVYERYAIECATTSIAAAEALVKYDACIGYHHVDTIPITIFMDLAANVPLRRSYSLINLSKDHGIEHLDAHTARADLIACIDLLKVHIATARGQLSPVAVVEKKADTFSRIIRQSSDAVWTFQYGAHKGQIVEAVAKETPSYIMYVLGFTDLNPEHRVYLESLLC